MGEKVNTEPATRPSGKVHSRVKGNINDASRSKPMGEKVNTEPATTPSGKVHSRVKRNINDASRSKPVGEKVNTEPATTPSGKVHSMVKGNINDASRSKPLGEKVNTEPATTPSGKVHSRVKENINDASRSKPMGEKVNTEPTTTPSGKVHSMVKGKKTDASRSKPMGEKVNTEPTTMPSGKVHSMVKGNITDASRSKPIGEKVNTEPNTMPSGKVHSMVKGNITDAKDDDPSDSNAIIEKLKSDLNAAISRGDDLTYDLINASQRINSLESQIQTRQAQAQVPPAQTNSNDRNEVVALAAAKRKLSKFQLERNESVARIFELEQTEQNAQKELEKQQNNFEELKNIAQTEETELKRLWAEVSEARLRIASLEQERIIFSDKMQDVKEEREKAVDKCNDLETELQKAKEEIDSMKEIVFSGDNSVDSLKSHLILAKERSTKLDEEKQSMSLELIDLQSELSRSQSKIDTIDSDLKMLQSKYDRSQLDLHTLQKFKGSVGRDTSFDSGKDLAASKRDLSRFQMERKKSIAQLFHNKSTKHFGLDHDDSQPSLEDSEGSYEEATENALRDIADTEGSELSRLWTEVSEARKQIEKLEQENSYINAKIHEYEESDQIAKDQCEDLQSELLQSHNEVTLMKEVLATVDGGFNKLQQQFDVAQRRMSGLEAEKQVALSYIQELQRNKINGGNDRKKSVRWRA